MAARKKDRVGINWSALARFALLVGIGGAGWLLWPGFKCSYRALNAVQIGSLTEDGSPAADWTYGRGRSAETARTAQVQQGAGFMRSFTQGVPACMIGAARRGGSIHHGMIGGGFGLFVLFTMLARAQWRSQIRKAARAGGGGTQRTGTQQAVRSTGRQTAVQASPREGSGGSRTGASARVGGRGQDDEEGSAGPRLTPTVSGPQLAALDPIPASFVARPSGPQLAVPTIGSALNVDPGKQNLWDDWDDAEESQILKTLLEDAPSSRAGVPTVPPAQHRAALASPPLTSPPPPAPATRAPEARTAPEPLQLLLLRTPAACSPALPPPLAVLLNRPLGPGEGGLSLQATLCLDSGGRFPLLDVPLDRCENFPALRTEGRGKVRLPERAWQLAMRNVLTDLPPGSIRDIEWTVSLGQHAVTARTALHDTITLKIADVNDALPVRPGLVRLTGPDGQVQRVGFGSRGDGLLRVGGLQPGTWLLEMEDELRFATAAGPPSRQVQISTDHWDAVQAEARLDQVRILRILVPLIGWVRAGTQGSGTEESPWPSIEDALIELSAQRDQDATHYRPIEVRLLPAELAPWDRPDLVGGAHGMWMRWWTGQVADRRIAWSEPCPAERPPSRWAGPGRHLDTPLWIDQFDDLRVINASYAALREEAAGNAELAAQLDQAYGELPMAVLAPAPPDVSEAWRARFTECRGVRLEGLALLGRRSLGGVSLERCHEVLVQRCWFSGFQAGPVPGAGGTFASGRALQLQQCGEEEWPIEVVDCDFSHNSAVRPSLPVQAAAVAAWDSWAVLTRCMLHHNRATSEPPDVMHQGAGRVRGDATNHRQSNEVVSTDAARR
jgi:hypothetical protein